jgi:hypothetical protein
MLHFCDACQRRPDLQRIRMRYSDRNVKNKTILVGISQLSLPERLTQIQKLELAFKNARSQLREKTKCEGADQEAGKATVGRRRWDHRTSHQTRSRKKRILSIERHHPGLCARRLGLKSVDPFCSLTGLNKGRRKSHQPPSLQSGNE